MSVCIKVRLEIVGGNIVTYNNEGTEMFCHKIRNLQKLAIVSSNKCGVVYVYREFRRLQVILFYYAYACYP